MAERVTKLVIPSPHADPLAQARRRVALIRQALGGALREEEREEDRPLHDHDLGAILDEVRLLEGDLAVLAEERLLRGRQ